jgi:hypothetical protein
MSKISNKAFRSLLRVVSEAISLNNVKEFEDDGKLFKNPPDLWNDMEKQLCDYQARITNELCVGFEDVFKEKH